MMPPKIPTENPRDALEFCRKLASLLDAPHDSLQKVDNRLPPTISIVIPVYEEQENLPTLYTQLTNVLNDYEPNYEIIFIDDGIAVRAGIYVGKFDRGVDKIPPGFDMNDNIPGHRPIDSADLIPGFFDRGKRKL